MNRDRTAAEPKLNSPTFFSLADTFTKCKARPSLKHPFRSSLTEGKSTHARESQ